MTVLCHNWRGFTIPIALECVDPSFSPFCILKAVVVCRAEGVFLLGSMIVTACLDSPGSEYTI